MSWDSIAEQIEEIRHSSIAWQEIVAMERLEEPLGGHIAYPEKEETDHLNPPTEFFVSVFEECAAKLGFKYEYGDR